MMEMNRSLNFEDMEFLNLEDLLSFYPISKNESLQREIKDQIESFTTESSLPSYYFEKEFVDRWYKLLINENQLLEDENVQLSAEDRRVKDDNELLINENKVLKDENVQLSAEKRRVEDDNELLINEIKALNDENVHLTAENRRVKDDNELLINENRVLKDENEKLANEKGQLTLETKQLRLFIEDLLHKGQLPGRNMRTEESHNSQSINQVDHPSINQQCDDLEMNDVSMSEAFSDTRVFTNELAPNNIDSFLRGLDHSQMNLAEFSEKHEVEVTSNVLLDFSDSEGEQRTVGRYSFPLFLIPIVERINEVYGDVSAKVCTSHKISEPIYVLFCIAIKEMDDLQLEEVTENKMLKWGNAIKVALQFDFNVRFAMEHLKKIARAYFGLPAFRQLESITANISRLEAELEDYKSKHGQESTTADISRLEAELKESKSKNAKIYEDSKTLIDATREFTGVPVITGLFTVVRS